MYANVNKKVNRNVNEKNLNRKIKANKYLHNFNGVLANWTGGLQWKTICAAITKRMATIKNSIHGIYLKKLCIKAQQHLPPVHLDLFVVAVQLGYEEHQHPVHLDLFVVAVQLDDEEHQHPVHLDLFVVAVQLVDEEHQHPVHLDLFGLAV
jgi:hypothetical protein